MASATAPPTPVSISSKTSVGAEPLSASTTFRASMKRASSPPEATFISGPGLRAGIGLGPELDPVEAGRIAALLVRRDLGDEAGALELQRRQLRSAPRRRAPSRRACRAGGERSRRRRHRRRRPPPTAALERAELFLAGVDRLHVGGDSARRARRARSAGTSYFRAAARSANRRSSACSSSRGSNSVARIACSRALRASSIATSAASSALTLGSTSAGACAAAALELAQRGRRAPAPASPGRRRASKRIGEVLRHLLGLHHDEAALGERRLLAGLRRERAELLDGMAQEIGLLAGALDPGAMLVQRRPRLAQARAPPLRPRAPRRCRPPKASRIARCVAGSTSARSSCWPWISTSVGADRAQHLHAHRLVVDEGAGAAVRELHAAQDEVAVGVDLGALRRCGAPDGRRARSKTAVTCPCGSPWRTRPPSPRAPSASAKASRRIDLPAPVSPVRTERPSSKSSSSRSIRTMSRIASCDEHPRSG